MEQYGTRNRCWWPLVDTLAAVRYWSAGILTWLLTIWYITATVLFSPWFKVLPTKFLQHWSESGSLAVVTVAKPGSTPLCRLHFDYVGFCYSVPYHQSIFKLWMNYGLAAEEGYSLIFFVTLSIWLFQDRVLSTVSVVTPRYLALEVSFKVCPLKVVM